MADVLTLVFRAFMSEPDLKKTTTPAPPASTARAAALLVGDRSISRSVLLLAAVTAASELDARVAFFSHTRIQRLPASLQQPRGPGLSPEALKRITFSYPRTVEDLLQQVACLHEAPASAAPPALIVVDGLEGFLCGAGRPSGEQACAAHLSAAHLSAAHLSALLCDTAAFLTQVLQRSPCSLPPCRILASFHSDSGPQDEDGSAAESILNVLHRYFQVRCMLDKARGYEAAAAGLQELWHVYLSGISGCEDGPGGAQEWELLVFPNGLMEFRSP